MTFSDTLRSVPGLTHYYPLATDAKDAVGSQHGSLSGVTFKDGAAVFDGKSSISLGSSPDFSVATKGGLTVLAFLTIADWRGAGASEYVHWAGKGRAGAHEWTFRHYVKGGTGEASSRQGRTSFYHFNPAGSLGAGSYFQDSKLPTTERVVAAFCDLKTVGLAIDGVVRDTDPLSGYSIVPKATASPAMLGTRGDGTGFLVGKLRDVAFFNRVLTSAEIKKLYDARAEVRAVEDPLLAADESELVRKHNALVAALRTRGSL